MKTMIPGLLAVALLAGPMAAQATFVTVDFQATVIGEFGSPFAIGDTINATLVYDDAVTGTGDPVANYFNAIASFSISGPGFTDTLGGSDPGVTQNRIEIRDGVSNAQFPVADQFEATLRDATRIFTVSLAAGTATPPFTNPSCISGTALPSPSFSYDLSCFNSTSFFYNNSESSTTFAFRASGIRAVSVPEPGALALLGLGLAGFGLSRRRKA